jgi:hypothetical protein
MVFWGRKQIFSDLGVAVLGVFFIQMRVDAQIPQREEDVAPDREMMEEQAAEAARGVKDKALVLTGYVDATYMYNFGPGTATSPIDFPNDTIPKGDFNLSALWLRLDKPLNRENTLEAGFQAGFMLGEDATLYAAAGSANQPSGPDSNALYVGEAFAKFWVPEAQMEMWVGKFQSVIGYETIWRPDNPCITFGIADAFMPQDNIGFLAIFAPDSLCDVGVGLGNCSGESNDLASFGAGDEAAIFSYLILRNPKENARLQPGFYATPWGTHGSNARVALDQNSYYAWNLIGDWSPLFAEDHWKLTFNVTGGSGTGQVEVEAPTTYVTTALYSTWTLMDPVTLTGRAEYVHTSNYVLPLSTRLSGGDFYDYTLTLAVKITEELVWRGEGRFGWGAGATASVNSTETSLQQDLYAPASNSLWTLATEVYYRF